MPDPIRRTGAVPRHRAAASGQQDVIRPDTEEARASVHAAFERRAAEGNDATGPTRSSRELRRGFGHLGTRDAKIARLRVADMPADQLRTMTKELQREQALNAVAEVMYVVGADLRVVELLDDANWLVVSRDPELSSSASFDPRSRVIEVSQEYADELVEHHQAAVAAGLLTQDGSLVAGMEEELDASTLVDPLIRAGTLLGIHEAHHAEHHQTSHLDELHVDASISADEAWAQRREKIDEEEYGGYHAQERADMALGAGLSIQLTTGELSGDLDRQQAVDNILAFERGMPLPYGPDAGWVRIDAGDGGAFAPLHLPHGDEHFPGWKRPGWKRPGIDRE